MDNTKTENIGDTKKTLPETGSRSSRLKPKEIIKKLPDHKPHLEFISALLTIPVLITVFLLNFNSLRARNAQITPTPAITITPTINTTESSGSARVIQRASQLTSIPVSSTPQPTVNQNQCTPGIGSIDVAYPQENQTISNNPVCISVNYNAGNYCTVVWAYSINGGPVSDYANNNICLYNLPAGSDTILVDVKSLVSNTTTTVTRHFTYLPANQLTPTLTPTDTASASAGTH